MMRDSRTSATGRYRRIVVTALAAISLLAGTAASAEAQGQVGWHGPAQVSCYDSGRILLEPRYDSIRNLDQWVGHSFQIYSYATGKWSTLTDWRWYHVLPGQVLYYPAIAPSYFKNVTPGAYYIYTSYAWSVGGRVSGQTGDYTASYGFAQGDRVVVTTNRCYPYPAFTTVGSVNTNVCATFNLCASAAKSGRDLKLRRSTTKRWHSKRLPPPLPPSILRPSPPPR